MNQLRYLVTSEVQKSSSSRRANGSIVNTYTKVNDYKIQLQELSDEVSFSIYGANVNRMYRICSPHYELEKFLFSKVNNLTDNISKYTILINSKRYKIVNVRSHWIDVELL